MIVNAPPTFSPVIFRCRYPCSLKEISDGQFIRDGFKCPLRYDLNDRVKKDIRDMLRQDGFKPTGRNKPASEYLRKAFIENWISPERGINAAVDICNVISLHSGLPISVIDEQKTKGPLSIALLPHETNYVFNPSGQILKGSGLLALCDREGPSATPVKDAQRTKTDGETQETITIIWGHCNHTDRIKYAAEQHILLYDRLQVKLEKILDPSNLLGSTLD